MPVIKMPDGALVRFSDDTPSSEINSFLDMALSKPAKQAPSKAPQVGASSFNEGLFADPLSIDTGVAPPRQSVMEGVVQDGAALPMVRPEFRQQVTNQYNTATPAQRQTMAAQPTVAGGLISSRLNQDQSIDAALSTVAQDLLVNSPLNRTLNPTRLTTEFTQSDFNAINLAKPSPLATDTRIEAEKSRLLSQGPINTDTLNVLANQVASGQRTGVDFAEPSTEESLLEKTVRNQKDLGISLAGVGVANTAKTLVDVGRLVTGDAEPLRQISEGIGDFAKTLSGYRSTQFQLDSIEFDRQLKDGFNASGILEFFSENPAFFLSKASESVATMFPVIKGAQLAQNSARALEAVKLLPKAQQAAVLASVGQGSATTVGALLNAADAFDSTKGSLGDKYEAAGVAGLFSLVGGALTKGGAEGAIVSVGSSKTVGQVALNTLKATGRENAQEFLEEGGAELGKQIGEGKGIDAGQIFNQGLVGAALSTPMGLASGAASEVGSLLRPDQPSETSTDLNKFNRPATPIAAPSNVVANASLDAPAMAADVTAEADKIEPKLFPTMQSAQVAAQSQGIENPAIVQANNGFVISNQTVSPALQEILAGDLYKQTANDQLTPSRTPVVDDLNGNDRSVFDDADSTATSEETQVKSSSLLERLSQLGGLSRDEATSTFGIDPAEYTKLGTGISRVFTSQGMTLDSAVETLAEEGYLTRDANGKADVAELEQKIDLELRGKKQFGSLDAPVQTNTPDQSFYSVASDQSVEAQTIRTALGQMSRKTGSQAFDPASVVFRPAKTGGLSMLAKALGVKVVEVDTVDNQGNFSDGNGLFNGFYRNGTIYMNRQARNPELAVFGHEFFHNLEKAAPKLADQFKATVAMYRQSQAWGQYREVLLSRGYTEKQLSSENPADFFGLAVSDPKFLRGLAKKEPSIFKSVVSSLRTLIARVKSFVNPQQAELQGLLTNYEAVLDSAIQIASEFGIAVRDGTTDQFQDQLPDPDVPFSLVGQQNADAISRGEIATRMPTAKPNPKKPAPQDPVAQVLFADFEALKSSPTLLAKQALLLRNYVGIKGKNIQDNEKFIESFINQSVDNLLWLHDQVPADTRERSKLWYDGAEQIAQRLSQRWGVSQEQAAGMLAVLSPQKDWFQNVSAAERVGDILSNEQESVFSQEMADYANGQYAEKVRLITDQIAGKKLKDLDQQEQAIFIRTFSEVYHDKAYAIVSPEGDFLGNAKTLKGKDSQIAWGSFSEIGKAVSLYFDGSRENLNRQMGGQHKVRNFYNNINTPKSENGYVTIDTHAVAAALLRPLSGKSIEVEHNFGGSGSDSFVGLGGSYSIYAEAYQRAAAQRGLLAREMQSITWEAIRGLYEAKFKGKSANVSLINQVWNNYQKAKITLDEARNESVRIAGGISEPQWKRPDNRVDEEVFDSSYKTKLSGAYARRQRQDGGRSGRRAIGNDSSIPQVSDKVSFSLGDQNGQSNEARLGNAGQNGSVVGKNTGTEGPSYAYSSPAPGAVKVYAVHFSSEQRKELNGKFYGSGLRGSESRRLDNSEDPRLLQRVYFYADAGNGIKPETGVGTKRHKTTLENIYDPNSGLVKWPGNANDYESAVLDAGYDGYVTDFGNQKAVVLMGDAAKSVPTQFDKGLDNEQERFSLPDSRPRDGGGRQDRVGAQALPGAPSVQGAKGPDPRLVEVAEQYAKAKGIALKRQSEYVEVDPARATRIAREFDRMEHAPNDPAVIEAYENLIKQTMAQYEALAEAGYKFWFLDPENDIYQGNPWNAMRDLRNNQSMGVFPTEAGFGSGNSEYPGNLLENPTELRWPYGGPNGPLRRVYANDLFRAVHDAFGHGLEGAGFRDRGEENAWQAHIRLFTGSAVGAITTETRGQNSWLNFGPYAEVNRIARVEETVFAPQKMGLMPEWTWTEGRSGDEISFSLAQTETPEFKRWSENLPIIEPDYTEDYRGGPAVFKVFHGSTFGGIEVVDTNRGNKDGAMGAGFYTSTSVDDVNENYAGFGPDLTNRISLESERISEAAYDDDYVAEELIRDYLEFKGIEQEVDEDNLEELRDEYLEKAVDYAAKKTISGDNQGVVMPLYVKVKNPFDARPGAMYFDPVEQYNEDTDEYESNEDGNGLAVYNAIQEVAGYYGNPDVSELVDVINNGDSAYELFEKAKSLELYDDSGELVSGGQFIQDVAREAGFDALIMDADDAFGTGRRGPMGFRANAMKGVNPGTLHIMPFKSNQVKSATGNSGQFGLENDDIRFSLPQTETPEFKRWFGESKVVDENGQPLVVYHGTYDEFNVFEPGRAGGIYFTEDRAYAAQYGDYIVPAYLTIQKMADLSDPESPDYQRAVQVFNERGGWSRSGAWEDMGRDDPNFDPSIDNTWEIFDLPEAGIDELFINDGYDGLKLQERPGINSYVVFEPTQIKSATGNNGQFDPANPDIRFSLPSTNADRTPIIVPNQTALNRTQANFEDNGTRQEQLERIVQEAAGQRMMNGRNVSPYNKREIYPGVRAELRSDFITKEVDPFMVAVKKAAVSLDRLMTYRYALHAEERNIQIASIDPNIPDGGSGMPTQVARDLLAGKPAKWKGRDGIEREIPAFGSGEIKRLYALQPEIDKLIDGTRDLLVSTGLEDKDTVDIVRGKYKYWIPLAGTEDTAEDSMMKGVSPGFSVFGSTIKRALGRDTLATDIFGQLIQMREQAIDRAQKNEVGLEALNYFLELQRDGYDLLGMDGKPLVQVNPVDTVRYFKKGTAEDFRAEASIKLGQMPDTLKESDILGYVNQQYFGGNATKKTLQTFIQNQKGRVNTRDFPAEMQDNTSAVRVGGNDVLIRWNDQGLAEAYRNIGVDQLGDVMGYVKPITNYYRNIYTGWNPFFWAKNLIRDLQATTFGSVQEGYGMPLKVMSSLPTAFREAFKGIYRDGSPLWDEYRMSGARTGFVTSYKNAEERQIVLLKEFDKINSGKKSLLIGKAILEYTLAINNLFEDGVRMSVFLAGKKDGMSTEEAATMVRRVTPNYNRKGNYSEKLSAAYVFFNAAAQGSRSLRRALMSKEGQVLAGAVITASTALNMMTALMMGEDDDGEPLWNSEQVRKDRTNNILIPTGNEERPYIKIPLAYGLNFIWNIGAAVPGIYLAAKKVKQIGIESLALGGAFADGFMPPPVGGTVKSGSALLGFTPTPLQLPMQLAMNKNGFGQQIVPDMAGNIPNNQKMNKSTRGTTFDDAAQGLNQLTGGTPNTEGFISASPEQLKAVMQNLFGTFYSTALLVGSENRVGRETGALDAPLLRDFVANPDQLEGDDVRKFYERQREIESLVKDVQFYVKDGDRELASRTRQENPQIALSSLAGDVKRSLGEITKQITFIRSSKTKTEAEKALLVRVQDKNRQRIVDNFNRKYNEVTGVIERE